MNRAATNVDLSRALLFAAGAILFLSFGYTEMMGSDMWWHLAAGRELLQTGTLWMVDHWSYSMAGSDWLNHEWLSDIIFIGWASAFDVPSLVYWKWLVIMATFSILQYVLYRQCGDALAAFLSAGLAVAIAAPFLDVRPHLYSLLNYALLLALLLERKPRTWVLALLFLIWVNLHGGFFFGLMALGILLFPWRDLTLANIRGAFVVGVICLLAATLNPSGVKTFLYPLSYAFDSSSPYRQLGEWLSPFTPGGIRSPLFFYFMWFPVVALLYTLPRLRKAVDVPWEGIALTALTLAMALTSRRFIPLFGMSLALMLAPLLGLLLQRIQGRKLRLGLAALALLSSLYRMLPYPLASGPAFHYLVAEVVYPVDTVNFMEANGIKGKVYALYNWGGYLHWRTDGDIQVYIDGRADTIFDARAYHHYVGVLSNRPGWMDAIAATGAEYVLWSNHRGNGEDKLRQMMASSDWVPVYQDSASWLLAHKSTKLPEKMRGSPATPWRDQSAARNAARGGNLEEAQHYAEKVREVMPWHQDACVLLISLHRNEGRPQEAQSVLNACRSYFPAKALR